MLNRLYLTFWDNVLRKAMTLTALAALLALAAVFLPPALERLDQCAEGVVESDGECIGVNGSGYDFGTPQITEVAEAIAEENRRIEKEYDAYVTVAMMLPLQPGEEPAREQLRSDVQGAYLAQFRVNREGKSPKMRLVLANPGDGYRQHDVVVDRLAEMAHSPEHNLRAVTGFNLSLDTTEAAIDRLTNELGIPVLASRISADRLANKEGRPPRFPGLARVLPTNEKQADALAEFHGDLPDKKTVLVRDTRPRDIYVQSLAEAFSRDEQGVAGPKDQPFRSDGISEVGSTVNDFTWIAHNICRSEAELVYFAGRPRHLGLFALTLAGVPCSGKEYTVVSGSAAATLSSSLDADQWQQLADHESGGPPVTVRYAAPAHPDAWDRAIADWKAEHANAEGGDGDKGDAGRPAGAPPAYLTEPQREMALLRRATAGAPSPIELTDSRTIMVYDGVRTIAEAFFLAGTNSDTKVPTLVRVAEQWPRLESAHHVAGASGWICLTNAGNPYDKPVSVVELDPETQEPAFVGLSWPEGDPQPPGCVVPSDTD